jgi:hypothetical protein
MDSFVVDFSQIGGVKNFGLLGIKKDLLDGYQLDTAIQEFAPTINTTKIDSISLQIAINTISAIYSTRKSRMNKQKKIRTLLLRSFKKYYNVVSLMEWLKSDDTLYQVNGKRTIIILYLGSDAKGSPCNNILSMIPVGFSEIEKKKLMQLSNYDNIDKLVVYHYKTIFREIFKKANKDTAILDHIFTLSWNERVTTSQITNYIKQMNKITVPEI